MILVGAVITEEWYHARADTIEAVNQMPASMNLAFVEEESASFIGVAGEQFLDAQVKGTPPVIKFILPVDAAERPFRTSIFDDSTEN